MKQKLMIWWIVLLSFALIFGVAAIALTVKKEYAKNHYEQTVVMQEYAGVYGVENTLGCGKMDCKYCNGQKVGFVYREVEGDSYYYMKFIYYRTLVGFWVTTIALASVCAVGGGIVLAKWRKKPRVN